MKTCDYTILIVLACAVIWGALMACLVHPVVGLACGVLAFPAGLFVIALVRAGGKQ